MTIGIDCRFASTQSGLGRYTRELVTHLIQRDQENSYVLFVSSDDNRSWLPAKLPKTCSIQTVSFRHYSLGEQLRFPGVMRRAKIDLFFAPHFNVPYFCRTPFVATIHDLILHRYPNDASAFKQRMYHWIMHRTVMKSKALIAVSKFTADEIVKTYGKDIRKKITVVHEAVSGEFSRKSAAACGPVLKKYALKKPFFLYVGNAKEHKNVQMLIDAYASLKNTENELVLVTGGQEADKLQLSDGVRLLRDVSNQDLSCLYFFAACFVTASLYEGFGLPVLEAYASGCPIIVTNCGALPEIAPEGARIVEPVVGDLADALRELPNPSEIGTMRSWSDTAIETIAVFNKMLSTR